jgi:hypothetical protein
MEKYQLLKIRDLIAENKLEEAIKQMMTIASEISRDLYNDVISLSSRLKKWDKQDAILGSAKEEERNKIVSGLLKTIDDSEKEITQLVSKAKEAEKNGNYHAAVASVEKVLILVEDESLRNYKVKLTESILSQSPHLPSNVEKFSFVWTFITVVVVTSIMPACIIIFNPNSVDFDIPYVVSLVLHISLIMCMVLYTIKPRIDVDNFINEADEFIRVKFDNRIDYLKWFSERANESIKQFGRWWRYLGISFLSLYVFYYFYSCILGLGYKKLMSVDADLYVDVIVNGSEAFFLFILYRILTDETIKPSPSKDKIFEQDLNIQAEIGVFAIIGFLFIVGSLFFYKSYGNELSYQQGVFVLISRIASGGLVAVSLSLVIGRFDSKFIEPKKWELYLLYSYAAIQLLFLLFDHKVVSSALYYGYKYNPTVFNIDIKNIQDTVKEFLQAIKWVVLYLSLMLKAFFIFFVIKIHQKNELFYYLLLGSKLNDEIKEGKKVNKSVIT